MNSKKLARIKVDAYCDKHLFYGLTNLNDGFDIISIKYFSEKDFEVVFGEWAKWVGGNLKGVVDEFNGCHECTNFFKLKTNFK